MKTPSAQLWDLSEEELRVEACRQYDRFTGLEGVEPDGFHRLIYIRAYIAGAGRGWFRRHQRALSECSKCEERYPGGLIEGPDKISLSFIPCQICGYDPNSPQYNCRTEEPSK